MMPMDADGSANQPPPGPKKLSDLCFHAQLNQSFRRLLERFDLLAKRKARNRPAKFRPRVETHSRNRRDSNLFSQPDRKLPALQIRDLGEIREYIVGALRSRVFEPGLVERRAHDVPASAVLEREMVVVIDIERHPDRSRRLQRSWRSHRQKIVDFPNW